MTPPTTAQDDGAEQPEQLVLGEGQAGRKRRKGSGGSGGSGDVDVAQPQQQSSEDTAQEEIDIMGDDAKSCKQQRKQSWQASQAEMDGMGKPKRVRRGSTSSSS